MAARKGRVEGKVALVTGARGGIGRATAVALAAEGAQLVLGDVADLEASARAVFEAGDLPAVSVRLDVTSPSDAEAAVARAVEQFGRLDILVNNAGVSWGARPEEMPLDKWERVIGVNLTGAFLFAQAAGREMLKRSYGRIINVSSVSGLQSSADGPFYVGYAASKAGLFGLTRELAASWGRQGIRVNAIAPGFFHSRLADAVIEQAKPEIRRRSPIPRVGEAGELKGVAVFLASDASNYITGQTIVVDGGRTIV